MFNSNLRPLPQGPLADARLSLAYRRVVTRLGRSFIVLVLLGIGSVIYWASQAQIDVVTRGSGQVVPELQNQFVQHLEGGIIDEILIAEGSDVQAGEVLIRIKDSFSDAEFQQVNQQIIALKAELARLEAEASGYDDVVFPPDLVRLNQPVVDEQTLLFKRRQSTREETRLVLEDQIRLKSLLQAEVTERLQNTRQEFEFMNERVSNLAALAQSGATSRNELLRLQLELQAIRTRLSDLAYQVPRIEIEIDEIRRRQEQLRAEFVAEANERMITRQNDILQLEASLQAMLDRESRSEVRSPIDGTVHRLFQSTIGGVVQGGQNLVQIVPTQARVSIEVDLAPQDRGRIYPGLPAVIKISAYDFAEYGGIDAVVTEVSSDVIMNETGQSFYRVNLEADPASFSGRKIVPGMSAEANIITDRRTILDYFLSPIVSVSDRALREG